MTIQEQYNFLQAERAKDPNISSQVLADKLNAAKGYIPENTERGFVGNAVNTAGMIVGGLAGGAALGPAGAIGGAALGGAASEALMQGVEKLGGQRKEFNPAQIVGTGATGAGLEAVTAGTGPILEAGAKIAKPAILKVLSKASGYGEDLIAKALERTPGLKEGLGKGEKALTDVIKKVSSKVEELAVAISDKFGVDLKNLSKVNPTGAGEASNALNQQELGNFVKSTAKNLRDNRITVKNTGELVFERPVSSGVANARMVSPAEQKQIQLAYDELRKLTVNSSLKNVEAVAENLRALKKYQTATGPQTSAIIEDMFSKLSGEGLTAGNKGIIETLYPELHALRSEYGPQREIINEARDLFGKPNASVSEQQAALTRLRNLYNEGKSPTRAAIGGIGEMTGQDVSGTAAGAAIKAGPAVSPTGIIGKAVGAAAGAAAGSLLGPAGTTAGTVAGLVAADSAKALLEKIPRVVLNRYLETGELSLLSPSQQKFLAKYIHPVLKATLEQAANTVEVKKTD